MYYQHHIMLTTAEQLDSAQTKSWFTCVKTYGPEDIAFVYNVAGDDIGMEYGVREHDEFSECYIVPLKRDLTQHETQIIVAAWDYIYDEDFDIEISNQYNTDTDYEFDMDEEVETRAKQDMKKWHHNRWVAEMSRTGWRYGTSFSESKQTHPALRDWDSLPESHRRSPDFSHRDITEWLSKLL